MWGLTPLENKATLIFQALSGSCTSTLFQSNIFKNFHQTGFFKTGDFTVKKNCLGNLPNLLLCS